MKTSKINLNTASGSMGTRSLNRYQSFLNNATVIYKTYQFMTKQMEINPKAHREIHKNLTYLQNQRI